MYKWSKFCYTGIEFACCKGCESNYSKFSLKSIKSSERVDSYYELSDLVKSIKS